MNYVLVAPDGSILNHENKWIPGTRWPRKFLASERNEALQLAFRLGCPDAEFKLQETIQKAA